MGKFWLYVNRGEIFDLANLAKQTNAVFARFEHPYQKHNFNKDLKKAHAHYQPDTTLVIDLTESEDEILAQIREK